MMFRKTTLALALGLASLAAQAASFNFNGQLDAGPLLGQSFSGQYSYADAALGGVGSESLSLTSFSLSFLGHNYGLADASLAPTADFQDGVFLGLSYQYASPTAQLNMTSGSFDASDAYLKYQPTSGIESSGAYAISAVPEPSSWALSLAGLLALGMLVRRRQA